ncbi:Transglycosylase SLT domain protein [Ruegeria sp. THAF57]|uniref:transglycosylase SLT domain-containing protein n=1 Tax=Ruegeria sp. THAF57 TaxID=2744555 RepID=UPI0015DF42D7|nr:transglycosylase SLT domain-containing protein [Ruegeria sp. THAF57]CAD0186561.1 Transglycosylase SLT domain protein [Ruegeria sp. THAF57]
MPNRTILGLAFALCVAQAAIAVASPQTAALCDRAARRAALSHDVPIDVMRAITRVETGRTLDSQIAPWPWTINVEGRGFWFNSEVEAKSYIFNIFKAGKRSFDIGCFQINYRWHGKAFRSIDAMFDPRESADYAARFLKDLYAELGSWTAAAGAYHSRTPDLAAAYSGRFRKMRAELKHDPETVLAANDPLLGAAAPLIPMPVGNPAPNTLGSLVPTNGAPAAFISFN